MSHAVSGENLQSLGATTFLSDVVPVVQNEEAGQPNETFLSDVVPVVQNEEAGQPNETFLPAVVPVVQNKQAGQPLERHVETEPRYPPRTFLELHHTRSRKVERKLLDDSIAGTGHMCLPLVR
ncbi:hypothetical protein EMCRGX_G027373 [Ephydatia muelleri]